MREMTPAQATQVARLERARWEVTHQDDDTVYLAKRNPKVRSQTLYCQVDADGTVDGYIEEK